MYSRGMVALPVIDDVYRVLFHWAATGGQTAANVMHFKAPTLSASAVASQIDASVTQNMWSNVLSTATVGYIQVTKLDGSSATYQLATSGTKWQGAAGGTDFVPNVSTVVSLRTGQRGQRHRGRVFLPFQSETNIANGVRTDSLSGGQTDWNTFLNAMATGLAPLHVASYGHSEYVKNHTIVTNSWTPDSTVVLTATVEQTLATQRRRQSRLR